jgi:hypothetical protein
MARMSTQDRQDLVTRLKAEFDECLATMAAAVGVAGHTVGHLRQLTDLLRLWPVPAVRPQR